MPAGRPTEYRPEYVERAKEMCANGATDAELAHEFDVTVQTLYNWRNKYPEFLDAIKTNKPIADERVERSLFQRATGYERNAVKISFDKQGNPLYAHYVEFVPPDPTSMIFWLKNRKPESWRDKIEIKQTSDPLADLIAEFKKEYVEVLKPEFPNEQT